ncbi:cyclopropane fatty acid synthase [Dunaliella salina]|uniref:Cyclopropane fatty acid synthase n=1 Tax=Dunaliella salina TaxID=3046 RepID=A0ABQ7GYE0_DUNSA|nr:cyclopropane fatty acid synthase [Dunaliella salina]|eukprot:KAF5839621.1 cyclopropane fatty acid synthase [Dunaliella salina]
MDDRRKVAVVGSGISGLSAAWLLHRHGDAVTLFEKEAVCGGHTLTDHSSPYPVDLGFQVYNLTTYPHFVGFLESLGVDSEASDMSFALSMDEGKLEWGSHGLDTIFAQRSNLASPSFLRMISDVIRFGKEAPRVLEPSENHKFRDMKMGQYLQQEGYSQGFINNYVVPMCAAVWSVPKAQVMEFPVQLLIRFWVNHHLLDIFQRPLWRVVKGRSKSYVDKVLQELPDVRTSTGVASVRRAPASAPSPAVKVTTEAGQELDFDAVVFATHSDTTLRMLGEDADDAERDVLASHLPEGAPDIFVTLNPPQPPAADKTFRKLTLSHPMFSSRSQEAQAQLGSLQGRRGAFYAGAWCGYGFHEDGIRSAVKAVAGLGVTPPWTCRPTSPKMSLTAQWFMGLFDRFAAATVKSGHLRVILPNGGEMVYGERDPSRVLLEVPEGEEWRNRPRPCATLRVFDLDFFRKIVLRHDTGLGEAYMDKDFEVDSIGGMMAVIVLNAHNSEQARGSLGILNWIGDRLLYLAHLRRPNTIAGSRKNIEEHYDAGNDMYKLFLDESMMYSCAIHHPNQSLYDAQMSKLDAIIDAADLQQGQRVLEIGCGWGSFAIRAAQRTGCHVTGLTLSKEQLAEATGRVKAAGLQDNVTLLFCDYRDCQGAGTFDRVVSIEMIEAVGHEHLGSYFATIGRMLKPGGKAVIQAITYPDDRYEEYCNCSDFIREHVFPGGHLPSVGAMVEAARGTGLSLHETTDIGLHYAVTLREWRQRWEDRRTDVLRLGYSERFWRKYRFYFAYCEASFDARYIHNFHLSWVKDTNPIPAAEQADANRGSSAALAVSPMFNVSATSAAAEALSRELPSDPITQALLALYFFLAGMLVKGHAYMWLLPCVSCACAVAVHGVRIASQLVVAPYRRLTPHAQAWWCADLIHLVFSASMAAASTLYLLREPAALRLYDQPTNTHQPSLLVAASAGFFAFYLWLCIRYRLFTKTLQAVLQYTTLLLLFGVAAYEGLAVVPFLAAMLCSEVYSVFFLLSKLQSLAGAGRPHAFAC